MTVFCVGKGICSIQTNGDFSKRFGVENEHAVPLTFFFGPGEYITGIWSLSRGQGEGISLGPFLVVSIFSALLKTYLRKLDERVAWR